MHVIFEGCDIKEGSWWEDKARNQGCSHGVPRDVRRKVKYHMGIGYVKIGGDGMPEGDGRKSCNIVQDK